MTTSTKSKLFSKEYGFDLEVLEQGPSTNIGYSRNALAEAVNEDYFVVVDSDHELPHNIDTLIAQLNHRPDLGGVAGSVIEPQKGQIWQSGSDFYEVDNQLVRTQWRDERTIGEIAEAPFVEFDFVPHAGVLRTSCFDDYSWDPNFTNTREHADFFVGHWKETDWTFGICPDVHFKHYPGGDSTYVDRRFGEKRRTQAQKYFLEKWGYDGMRTAGYWYSTSPSKDQSPSILTRARTIYNENGVGTLTRRSAEKVSRTFLEHASRRVE